MRKEATRDNCYDPKLITKPKASDIQIISGIFPTQAIIVDPGNVSFNGILKFKAERAFLKLIG
jgi:hypothetical protein